MYDAYRKDTHTLHTPERLSNRTHAEYDMEVVTNPFHQVGKYRVWRVLYVIPLGISREGLTYLQESRSVQYTNG